MNPNAKQAWANFLLSDSDSEDEEDEDWEDEEEIILNADGSVRQVKRWDYSRGPKEEKKSNPWEVCKYLILYRHERVNEPTSRQGKKFRRKFRLPYPVFVELVEVCKETGEPCFCYAVVTITGEYSIPLELKIMSALRVLAVGCSFDAVADMDEFYV